VGCSRACGDRTCECDVCLLEVERGGGGWMSGGGGRGKRADGWWGGKGSSVCESAFRVSYHLVR